MFQALVLENCDVWVLAGDHSGSSLGLKGTRAVFKMAREYFAGPILACLGNHDYWVRGRKKKDHNHDLVGLGAWRYHHPDMSAWLNNYAKIVESAKEHKIHLFEEDGIYRFPDMWGFTFAGHGLWYKLPPNSNDHKYLPVGVEGDTHRYMYKRTTDALLKQLEGLNDKEDGIRIFVSHFPVVQIEEHDAPWAGDPFLGEMLMDRGFTTFLNGHTHADRSGPLRWECGSDTFNPKYKVVQV